MDIFKEKSKKKEKVNKTKAILIEDETNKNDVNKVSLKEEIELKEIKKKIKEEIKTKEVKKEIKKLSKSEKKFLARTK